VTRAVQRKLCAVIMRSLALPPFSCWFRVCGFWTGVGSWDLARGQQEGQDMGVVW
jgi:hypothetical protein